MIGKIVPFPIAKESPAEELDTYIRAYLNEMIADKDFINVVANRMKNFIEKYATSSFEPTFTLVVPPNLSREQADVLLASIDEGIQATAKEVQEMMRKIIFERLELEIQLYNSKKNIQYHLC